MLICNKEVKYPENELFEKLQATGVKFYLTGSRYFGYAKADSDWDFFTEFSQATVQFLHELGFLDQNRHGYKESTVSNHWNDIGIDIQLTHNVFIKRKVQEILFKYGLILRKTDKKVHREIWDAMYEAIITDVSKIPLD